MKFGKPFKIAVVCLFAAILIIFAVNETKNIAESKPTKPEISSEPESSGQTSGAVRITGEGGGTRRDADSSFKQALIVFTFDDGCESDYILAYPILQKHGIVGTSYINPQRPDGNIQHKMSWSEIRQMNATGWDFEDHTYAHMDLTKSTPEQIIQSMEQVDEAFMQNGLEIPLGFAYPYGKYNPSVVETVRQYRKQAREAEYTSYFVDLKKVDPYHIPSVSADMRTKTRLSKIEKTVDKARAQNAVLVFRCHCLYREKPDDMGDVVVQTSSKLFEELVNYCVKKGCSFTTMKGLMDLYA